MKMIMDQANPIRQTVHPDVAAFPRRLYTQL